ncbi:pseudouridine synthase [Jeongeupia naejangsanensis]|uniref:RNA pseudouridine synthase n=1 Tax=Jeongeupia naejangsanensis TaxID=613195 RepID=A0ABS2BQ63_9NEIS|nr:pseudouridine synthase [Jeongeupia naejangsanensis]MBM3117762.1 RNA pseudouridine synthase [Jeongeupia naejangsanensis]
MPNQVSDFPAAPAGLAPADPWQPAVLHVVADFVVAYKPPGLHFHRDGDVPGLVERVRDLYGAALWPVHRLDAITSGLIVLATSSDAAGAFGERFAAREMDKVYLALSDRKPAKKQGEIKGGMAAGRGGNWRLTREDALFARTRFVSASVSPGLRLYALKPYTGRTHQLRVAMKSISAPILGDARYGGSEADRGYLHATLLGFDWDDGAHAYLCPPCAGSLFVSDECRTAQASLGNLRTIWSG